MCRGYVSGPTAVPAALRDTVEAKLLGARRRCPVATDGGPMVTLRCPVRAVLVRVAQRGVVAGAVRACAGARRKPRTGPANVTCPQQRSARTLSGGRAWAAGTGP